MATNPSRLPAFVRVSLKTTAAILWLTGCGWLIAHFLFPQANEFGIAPNAWEAPLLRIHGILAVAGVFLFGWIASLHISALWRQSRNRSTGITLSVATAILVVSGYALYYVTSDNSRDAIAVAHEAIGGLVIVAALAHWMVRR